MSDLIAVGTLVVINANVIHFPQKRTYTGKIVGYGVDQEAEHNPRTVYLVALSAGLEDQGGSLYVRLIGVHPDNIKPYV